VTILPDQDWRLGLPELPGERVTLNFVITDATPDPEFFLLQRPGRLISSRSTSVVQR